jgi:hemerythrin-like domain-containing protein
MAPGEFRQVTIGNSHAWLTRAASAAAAQKVACESVSAVSDRPHEAILEAAKSHGCDLIYMASHGRRGLRRRITGTVTEKLLEIATIPVLVVRVETNSELTDEQRAVTVIRNEHRSLAAVIRVMLDLVAHCTQPSEKDRKWLGAALFYIEHFPERLHHPKEELTIFRLLRERTPVSHSLLNELVQQHRDASAELHELREALKGFVSESAGGRENFRTVLNAFAESQWRHMDAEELVIIPMAGRHLTSKDWASIAATFESHEDSQFDVDTEASFAEVLTRLMDLETATAFAR